MYTSNCVEKDKYSCINLEAFSNLQLENERITIHMLTIKIFIHFINKTQKLHIV